MQVKYINNKKTLDFGHYKVIKEKENFCGVYNNHNILLIHKRTWRQATKIAKLLEEAYKDGYDEADYDNNYHW